MSDDVQTTDNKPEVKRARNSPKTPRDVWDKVRLRFEGGDYTSLLLLAQDHGINPDTLRGRIFREKWTLRQQMIQHKVEQRMEQKTVSRVESYLTRLTLRSEKYEKMLDASISQQSTTNEGVPLCDVDQLDTLTRAELRVVEMSKVALRLAPPVQDVTTGGLSVGDSIVSAIAKLRESGKGIEVTDAQIDRVLEMEIVP